MRRIYELNYFVLGCVLTWVIISVLLSQSCASRSGVSEMATTASPASTKTQYDYQKTIEWDRLKRTYTVHLGHSYSGRLPAPLVVALHGHGGSGPGMAGLTGFNRLADRDNFIVVYPDGIEKGWNDGRIAGQISQGLIVDDVGFISAIIADISKDYYVDARRIFVTGMSNGAMMSHRLVSELSLTIAAFAPVAGNIPVRMASVLKPTRAVPVLIINGTNDPLVPWDGGEVHLGNIYRGTVLSVSDTTQFWVNNDQCSKSAQITHLSTDDYNDRTSVEKEIYAGGKDDSEVDLYKILGGGHTWPGGQQYLPESIIGKTSRQFSASEVIWHFFQAHPMK
jgi:polyhydroxybutyrate depolymerase